jgi:putative transcriptional regulator
MNDNIAKEIAESLKELNADLRSGEEISNKYDLRRVVLDLEPESYVSDDVKRVRKLLNASQAIFAQLLGVSVRSVQKWERNEQPPCTMAARFMDEIAANPDHFRERLKRNIRVKGRTDSSLNEIGC